MQIYNLLLGNHLTFQVQLCLCMSLDLPQIHCCLYQRSCPYGWTQHGARCFLFVNSGKNWDSAEHHCRILGGHLASFHSYSELNFLRHLVYTGAWSFRNTWVGGTDRGHVIWRWTDGSWYNYNRWYPGEPNNWFGREECMEINFRGRN
uniref:C-type lectin domain-containing protein n=1 Tax=Nothobranchius furzeri TaxID=105023 RepID=A0A8C6VYW6_NOTFU